MELLSGWAILGLLIDHFSERRERIMFRYLKYAVFVVVFLTGGLFSQEKQGEMSLSSLEFDRKSFVRDRERSALIVISEVPDLQFESTRLIYEVTQHGASEWWVRLEPGRQIVYIRAPGYQPIETDVFNFEAKKAFKVKVSQVRPIPGTLVINSNPDGAEIKINGVPIEGRTPLRLEEVMPGRFNIEVSRELYRPAFNTLEIQSNDVTEWNVDLTQSAVRVNIDLEDEDLTDVGVLIDGEPIGIAPGTIYLEPGTYQLVLQKPGYEYPEKVIHIDFSEEEIRLSEKLIPLSQPIYKKWWFYAGSAALVTGAAILISSGAEEDRPPLTDQPPSFPQ
jgi:hypothetical protein